MQNSQNIFTKNNSKPSVNIFNNANNSASQNLNNLSQNSQNMNSQRPNNIFTSSNNPQNANIPNSNSNNTQNQLNFQKPNNPSQPLNIPPKPKDSDRSGESNIERIISFSLIYQKVMQGIALSEMQQKFIQEGGVYFQTGQTIFNQQKKKIFQTTIKDKDHIGFGLKEKVISGDIPKSKYVDQIWIKLIKHFAFITQSNEMVGYELIKKEVESRRMYQKLYSPVLALNNKVFKLNQDEVQKFHVIIMQQNNNQQNNYQQGNQPLAQTQTKVDIQNPTYKEILQSMIKNYYNQHLSYLNIISTCFRKSRQISQQSAINRERGQRQKVQQLKKISNRLIKNQIVKELWTKYTTLWTIISCKKRQNPPKVNAQSRSVNDSPSKNNPANKASNQLLQKVILLFKKKIFQQTGFLILNILQDFYLQSRLVNEPPIQIMSLLNFIVNDNIHCDITLKLLLKLFPWKSFSSTYKREEQMQMGDRRENKKNSILQLSNQKKKQILNLIATIQDERFIGFKHISQFIKYIQRAKNKRDEGISWENLLQSGNWNMFGKQWRYWLGLLLEYVPDKEIFLNKQLSKHILQLCKTCIYKNIDQFWEINNFEERYIQEHESFDLFYMGMFMKSYSNQYGLQHILPILTKSLTNSNGKDYSQKVVNFVGFDQMKMIIEPIREILQIKIFNDEESENYKQDSNVNFIIQNVQHSIQQQLKFISKFVCVNIDKLSYVESVFFSGQYEQFQNKMLKTSDYGIKIISFLLICINKIDNFNISSIKCIKYIVKAIDFLFCRQSSRKTLLFLMSLYFSQIYSEQINKVSELVSLCLMTSFNGQIKRQVQKLRFAFSNHLCNMLRFSDSISDYFKGHLFGRKNNIDDKSQFEMYLWNIERQEYEYIYEYLSNELEVRKFNWFYQIARLLKHKRLLPIDFQNIYLLLNKMKIKNLQCQQFFCMLQTKQILNEGSITAQAFECVRPHYKKKALFDLSNFDMMLFFKQDSLQPQDMEQRTLPKYKNENYAQQKLKATIIKQKNNIFGRLNGSLRLIQCVLKLKYQQSYQLINQLTLAKEIYEKLTQKKNLVTYTIHTMDYEHHQWETNIHLALCSYLNLDQDTAFFQQFQKSRTPYNKLRNINLPIVVTTEGALGFNQTNINAQFFQNVMHDDFQMTFSSDYTIKGAVLRIYQLMFSLGKGSIVKNCLNNREWPKGHHIYQNQVHFGKNVQKLTKHLVQMLSNDRQSMTVRTQILQLMINMMTEQIFLQKIIDNLNLLKNSIQKILHRIIITPKAVNSIKILSMITYFVYNLVIINSSSHMTDPQSKESLNKFQYDYIGRFIQYPTNILLQITKCLLRMGKFQLGKIYQTSDMFANYNLQLRANHCTLFKTVFHLVLKIFSLYFSNLTPSTIIELMEIIIPNTQTFLMEPPNLSISPLAAKLNIFEKNSLQYSKAFYNLVTMQFSSNCFDKILSQNPKAYGKNYQYDYFLAFYKLKDRTQLTQQQARSEILSLQRVNCLTGLWHAHVYMTETFICFLLKIFKLGPYGYSMSDYIVDQKLVEDYVGQMKGDKFFINGRYDSLSMIGKNDQNQFKNLLFLFKTLLEYIFFNGKMYAEQPKNVRSNSIRPHSSNYISSDNELNIIKTKPSLNSCLLLLNQILILLIKVVPNTMNDLQNLETIKDLRDRLFIYYCRELPDCTLRILLLGLTTIIQTDFKIQEMRKFAMKRNNSNFSFSSLSSRTMNKHQHSFQQNSKDYISNQIPLMEEVINILTCGFHKKTSYRKVQRHFSTKDIFANYMLLTTLCQTFLQKIWKQVKLIEDEIVQMGQNQIKAKKMGSMNEDILNSSKNIQMLNYKKQMLLLGQAIYYLIDKFSQIQCDVGRKCTLTLTGNYIQLNCKIEPNIDKSSKFTFYQKFLDILVETIRQVKTQKLQRAACFNILIGVLVYDRGEVCQRIMKELSSIINLQIFFEYQEKNDYKKYIVSEFNQEISFKNKLNSKKSSQKLFKLRQSVNSYSTLTDLFQLHGLFGLICSFMLNTDNWNSQNKNHRLLDQFFIQILFEDILIIDSAKIVPTNKGQFRAKQIIVYQKKPRKTISSDKENYYYREVNRTKNMKMKNHPDSRNIQQKHFYDEFQKPQQGTNLNHSTDLFTFITNLKISEIVLYQMLIIQQGMMKSTKFKELNKKALRTKNQQINSEKMWSILKGKMIKFCQFYNDFVSLLQNQSLVQNMIKIYDYSCNEASYWTNFQGLTFLFNQYSLEEFNFHLVQSMLVFGQCCMMIYKEWKDSQWQNIKDWNMQRKEMMMKCYQLFKKMNLIVSLRVKNLVKPFQAILNQLKQALKQQILVNK